MAAKANSATFVKPCSSKKEDKSKKKQFRWNADMVDTQITCLHNYKSQMEYKNVDFDGDRPMQYTWPILHLATCCEGACSASPPKRAGNSHVNAK